MNFRFLHAFTSLSALILLWQAPVSADPFDHTAAENRAYEKSISELTAAIRINPNNGDVYCRRGIAHYELGHRQKALADSKKAVELNPKLAIAYVYRGLARADGGPGSGGADEYQDYTTAIKLDSQCTLAYICRGDARKDFWDMVRNYEAAIASDPEAKIVDGRIFWNLTGLYECSRQFQKEADVCSIALKAPCAHNDAGYLVRRATAYVNLGLVDKAFDDYTAAIKANSEWPTNAFAYGGRGKIFLERGQYNQAIDDLTKATSFENNDSEDFLNRGRAYRHLGQFQNDVESCNLAIKVHPLYSNPTAEYFERAWAHANLLQCDKFAADSVEGCRLLAIDIGQQCGKTWTGFRQRYIHL